MPASTAGLGDLVDPRYPIGDLGACGEVIAAGRRSLAERGVVILPGFVPPAAVDRLVAECRALEPLGHHSVSLSNPYLDSPDPAFPEGHPRRHLERAALSAVAYDRFPATSELRRLYESEALMRFVGALLDRWPLYRYADPFGALNVAVMKEGDELGWHFDMTDFVVSIALQPSETGGEFESVCRVRSTDRDGYDDVASVLHGGRDRVEVLPMTPGTFMLFEGRHSMHRVSTIGGPTPRYVALLAYDTKPGTDSTDRLKRVRYGRLP